MERRVLAEALQQLVRAPEVMLSRIYINRDDQSMQYTVKNDGDEVLMVISAEELNGLSVAEHIQGVVRDLLCVQCQIILLDGELGLCSLCESAAAMDLLAMSKAFR